MVDWSNVRARTVHVSDGLSALLGQMIADGTIPKDERLPPERDLAKALGVSRTSLREALHQLELKGLVDRRPGRGTIVLDRGREEHAESLLARLGSSERSLREVMDLRAVIEPPIAARAADRRTAGDLEELHAILARMQGEKSVARTAALDVQFHDAIARATHNPMLERLIEFAREWIDASRTRRSPRRRRRSIADHGDILAAIEERDAVRAERAMAEHIAAVNRLLLEEDA
jgi:DNA-binding FadR family transcriptional regulator